MSVVETTTAEEFYKDPPENPPHQFQKFYSLLYWHFFGIDLLEILGGLVSDAALMEVDDDNQELLLLPPCVVLNPQSTRAGFNYVIRALALHSCLEKYAARAVVTADYTGPL
ncbi:hypothetical protein RP20_CCG006892 [Aedes albopictus]|nr:hypothetical protein RP20_CCG006892 [Aedes albopictus]